MRLRWVWMLLCVVPAPGFSFASVSPAVTRTAVPLSWESREARIRAFTLRDSKFSSVAHIAARPSCEATQPPQALATPDPLLELDDEDARVTVSFIVGTDGRVHAPLILQSAGSPFDRTVLNAVRSWRYRPATCNGVPTEAEGRISFSAR